ETRVVDGVSRMREVPGLPVAAGGVVELRPGGLHLMLMRPVSPLAAGDVARVEFILSDGRSIGVDFEVRAADARRGTARSPLLRLATIVVRFSGMEHGVRAPSRRARAASCAARWHPRAWILRRGAIPALQQ